MQILLSPLYLSITTIKYNNDNNVLDDIGASRVVVGFITYGFGGSKGKKINNVDCCSHSSNKDMNIDNGDNDYSNYWNIEDSHKHILKEIL